ncbi:MAG: hypothetical protein ABII27_08530 [bacterium]
MTRQHFFVRPKIQIRYLLKTLSIVLITSVVLYVFLQNELAATLKSLLISDRVAEIAWVSTKTFIIVVIILLLAFGVHSIFSSHSLAGAVFALDRVIRNFGEGNLKASASLRKGDELKEISIQLQQMSGKFRNAIDEDRQRISEIRSIIEAIKLAVDKNETQENIRSKFSDLESKIVLLTKYFKV